MDTQLSDGSDRVAPEQAAAHLRAVLAEIDDPDTDFAASTATRRRIEGAALSLEALADRQAA